MVGQLRPWVKELLDYLCIVMMEDSTHSVMVNVLHVPELSCNLMSVRQITDRGFLIQFNNDRCRIKSVGGVTVAVAGGIKRGNLYVMEGRSERPEVLGEGECCNSV